MPTAVVSNSVHIFTAQYLAVSAIIPIFTQDAGRRTQDAGRRTIITL